MQDKAIAAIGEMEEMKDLERVDFLLRICFQVTEGFWINRNTKIINIFDHDIDRI